MTEKGDGKGHVKEGKAKGREQEDGEGDGKMKRKKMEGEEGRKKERHQVPFPLFTVFGVFTTKNIF